MKRIALFVVLALLSGSPAVRAEEAPKDAKSRFMMFFKNLKDGLRESSVKGMHQKGKVTAVAAVRGAPQDDTRGDVNQPSMKEPMKSKKAKQARKERGAFEEAVDLITAGKVDEGDAKLAAFEKTYPNSPMIESVQEARAQVQALKGTAPSAEPTAPEKPAETAPAAAPEPAPAEKTAQ